MGAYLWIFPVASAIGYVGVSLWSRRVLGSRADRRRFMETATEKIAISRAVLETAGVNPDLSKEERYELLRAEWPAFERNAQRNGVSAEKLAELRREIFASK